MVKKRKQPKTKRTAQPRQPAQNKLLTAMRQYDRLIRDPCGADFCYAPYFGTDSGYLMRTITNYNLTDLTRSGLTVGGNYTMSAIFAFAPGIASTAAGRVTQGTATAGDEITVSSAGVSVWPVDNPTTVARYRPVAACLKFIPSGPYQTRRGMIGLSYQNSPVMSTGTVLKPEQVSRNVLRLAPIGSEPHEIRWLPGETDHLWTRAGEVVGAEGRGTMYGCLLDIDGTASSATQVVANGYLEITVVWEWVPFVNSGLTTAPRAPLPFTTQQYLSTIDNVGNFLLTGVRRAGQVVGAAAATSFMSVLTRGVRQARVGRDSVPMIREEL